MKTKHNVPSLNIKNVLHWREAIRGKWPKMTSQEATNAIMDSLLAQAKSKHQEHEFQVAAGISAMQNYVLTVFDHHD